MPGTSDQRVDEPIALLESTRERQHLGRRNLPDDLVCRSVAHRYHGSAARLVDMEAQAALPVRHQIVQAADDGVHVDLGFGRKIVRQRLAACRHSFAGSIVRQARGTGCSRRYRRHRVQATCHRSSPFRAALPKRASLGVKGTARPLTCRPRSLSTRADPSARRCGLLTAAERARSAEPSWPATESRRRPAAGSAHGSTTPSRPRSPRQGCGCATRSGFR